MASGCSARPGRGTAEHFGLEKEVDIIMGTYSKSLASIGGFVAASEEVIHYIKHTSRPLIFSASPPPASVASVIAALDIIDQEPERRERLWHNTNKMMKAFKQMGFDTGVSETPIIPLVMGEMERAFMMWKTLSDEGVFVNPVVPPATPPGRCLIRTSYMATHTDEMLDRVLGDDRESREEARRDLIMTQEEMLYEHRTGLEQEAAGRIHPIPLEGVPGKPQLGPAAQQRNGVHPERKKNPFFHHAEAACFLRARTEKRSAGSRRSSTATTSKSTMNRPVFSASSNAFPILPSPGAFWMRRQRWLKERDIEIMRGPMNPSTNDECGFLLEGFDSPPMIMMTYTPAYYLDYMERCGMIKAKDLYAYICRHQGRSGRRKARKACVSRKGAGPGAHRASGEYEAVSVGSWKR